MQFECPCGLGTAYDECCGKYIKGDAVPTTAEALMRSRYSAYAMKEANYIVQTALVSDDQSAIEEWMKRVKFVKLEVVRTQRGKALDKKGIVEFRAWFEDKGKIEVLHEVSAFVKRKGRWFYDETNSFTP
jgi:SEC-C motif-containing protein